MSRRNRSSQFKKALRKSAKLIKSIVHTTLETFEERRLFAGIVAAPGGPYSVNEGQSVTISGLSSTDSLGTITSYQWDTNYSVSRGFRSRVTGSSWRFTATDSGTRTIALRVTDDQGNTNMATGTINIADVAPTLTLTAPNNATEGQEFAISWSYTDPGVSDNVNAWNIDWGDGANSNYAGTASTTTHTYDSDGTYTITLTSSQADGDTSITHSITVTNEVPQVNATTTTPEIDEGGTVNVSFSSPNRASTLDGWVIEWGDGQVDNFDSHASTATHVYEDNGNYTAVVRALEPDGGEGSANVAYTVGNVNPVIAITGATSSGIEGSTITVGSTATDAGSLDTLTRGWSVYRNGSHFVLPGGTNITATNFTFTPTDNGSYVIRLTVVDKDGGSTTVNSDAITVTNANPTASILGTPVGNVNEGAAINLTASPSDAGSEDTFTYSWSVTKNGSAFTLPGGTNTTSAAFSFTPTDNGAYIATVVVTDDDGGTVSVSSASITVVNVNPTASLSSVSAFADEGAAVSVTATPADAGAADTFGYAWTATKDGNPFTFPNGTVTDEATLSFHYPDDGEYVLTCTVTDDDGGTVSESSSAVTVSNVAPDGSISATDETNEGSSVHLTSSITDPGAAESVTYAWAVTKDGNPFALPGGTITNGTTLDFVPTDNGSYDVTLTVEDKDSGLSTITHSITVNNVDPSATITGAVASEDEGTAITVGSTAGDVGSDDTLTRGWSVYRDGQHFVLPGGTTINASNFTFTPTDNGSYVIRLTVVDDDGGETTVESDPITVGNVAPTGSIAGTPVGSIDEGTAVNLTVTATDAASEDTLSYAWSVTKDGDAYTLPGGTVTNTTSFSFTPTDNGSYVATCTVTDDDGGTHSIHTAAITVDNVAPGATMSNVAKNGDEGTAINASVSATDAGAADTLSYSWSVTKDGNPLTLPGNVVTNTSSFSFTPADNGTYVITATVTDDDGGTISVDSDSIVVANVDPNASMDGDEEGVEGSAVSYTSTVTDAGVLDTFTYLWDVSYNGNPLSLPGGVDVASPTFSFVPVDNGAYVVNLTVTDKDGGVATASMNLAVTNAAPVVDIASVPGSGLEGQAINVAADVSDAGANDTFTYLWTVTKNGQSYALANGTDTASTLSFTPDDNGTYVITLAVTDNDGATTSKSSASITVNNTPPTATIAGVPNTSINEADSVSLTSSVSDNGVLDTFSYAWTLTKNGQPYSLSGLTTNTSSFNFAPNDNGTFVATLTVTDNDGGSASFDSDPITVVNVNPTGTVTSPASPSDEGTPLSFSVAALDVSSADTFSYSWSVTKDGNPYTLPGGTATNGATFEFTPSDNGAYTATVVVTDDDGGTVSLDSDEITVANAAPVPTIAGNSSVNEGSAITLTASPNDPGSADTHTYSWSVTRNGSAFTLPGGTVTNSATFTFTTGMTGTYVASCVVTDDDGGTATASKSINAINVAPTGTITGVPVGPRAEGSDTLLTVHPTDIGGDTSFTYLWTVKKNNVAYTLDGGTVDNASTFTFTPRDNGSFVVSCAVTDSNGATGTINTSAMTITNALPIATISGTPVGSITEGTAVNLSVSAEDPGADDTFTYSWSVTKNGSAYTLPGGTVTNSTNFSFTPNDNGSYIATCVVTDDDGGPTTIATSAITVTNVNPTGSVTSPTSPSDEGTSLAFTATPADAGTADTFTYSWSVTKNGSAFTLPGGATTNAASFNFVPTDNGTYVATVVISDDDGGTVTATSSSITVNNVAPSGSITGSNSVDEGSTLTVTANPTDAGSADTFTYAWSVTRNGSAYTLPGGTVTNAASLSFATGMTGTYVASCVISDDDGASATVTKTVTVNNLAPTATITGTPVGSSVEGTAIPLTVNPSDPGGDTNFTYAWSVKKNNVTVTLPNYVVTNTASFNFIPTDNGSFVVSCAVTDSNGASSTVSTTAITVTNANPTGSISGTAGPIVEGATASYTVTASDVGADDTLTYAWSVTKNGSAYTLPGGTVTNTTSFSFSPNDNGSYVVTCVVTDDDGGSSSIHATSLTVTNAAPTAAITGVPTQAQLEGILTLLESTISDAGSADTHTYAWSITKDGHSYTLPEGVQTNQDVFGFVATDNGSYVVSLTVTDDDGASVTTSTSAIVIDNANPTGSINGPTNGSEGTTIDATVAANDDGIDDTLTYAWSVTKDGERYTLPEGTTTNATSFSFTPGDNGEYVLTCEITDDDGGSATATHSVTVSNVAPVASLTGASTADEGDELNFFANVIDPGADDSLTYAWSVIKGGETLVLPEGTVTNETGFSYVTTDNGRYTIQCVVTDDDGGTYTAAQNVLVGNIAPTVAITGVPETFTEGVEINFTSDVTDIAADLTGLTYGWTITKGDSQIASGSNADFSFVPPVHGDYTLNLTVTDKDGGAGTAEALNFTVANVAPSDAAITGMPETMVEGDEAPLSGSASDVEGDTLTYAWLIKRNGDDFATAATKDFTFSPHARGDYEVILTVTDTAGATTTTSSSITVDNVAPTAVATFPSDPVFLGDTASFGLNIGDVPSNQQLDVTWDFGDGITETHSYTGDTADIAKTHVYSNSGSFTVTITVSDGVDSTTQTSNVFVSRAAIRPDPLDSTKTSLLVVGSNEADTILVEPSATRGKLKVTINGNVQGNYAIPTGHVVVYGNGGVNNITVNAGVNALVYAGSSVATVVTGSGNDIVIGTPGADVITTGAGRDIIIGGAGRDTITAGESEDAVIADGVNWSSRNASIKLVEDTWGSSKALAARVADMKATGLFSTAKMIADTASDQLYGSERGDWFVLNLAADRIRDWQAAFDLAN